MSSSKQVYLAGPFFTPEQLALISTLEHMIRAIPGLTCYSPREDGVLKDMTPEQRAISLKRIFDMNCKKIAMSDAVLGVLNWRDTGTIWELGYAFSYKSFVWPFFQIVTYTDGEHQANVMLREAVSTHAIGLVQVEQALRNLALDNPIIRAPDNRPVF